MDQWVPEGTCSQFNGRLRLIRSVSRATKFPVKIWLKLYIYGFITPSLLASAYFGTFGSTFSTFRTTLFGEGSLMRVHYPKCARIWSILLIESDLKWCLHLSSSKSLFIFQLLGECYCWWTSESPRAHVAKFNGRLRLIRSVLRATEFSVKIDWNCVFGGLLHHHFWLRLVLALSVQHFLLLEPLYLAKDHWWGFSTRNAHMVHIANWIWFNMV